MAAINPFMIGKIAVHVIFVDGPSTALTFTPSERIEVRAKLVEGLTILSNLAMTNVPVPKLQFSLELQTIAVAVPDAFSRMVGTPTSGDVYEARESPWRDAVLSRLGHPTGGAGLLALRNATIGGADHGFTVWITKYELAWPAYASKSVARLCLSLPFLKAFSNLWTMLDRVIAHEIGHIFQAPDEYDDPVKKCTLLNADGSGYGQLDFPNMNCESVLKALVPPQTAVPCIMNRNSVALCSATRTHWGWIDSDGDGKFDVFP